MPSFGEAASVRTDEPYRVDSRSAQSIVRHHVVLENEQLRGELVLAALSPTRGEFFCHNLIER